MPSLMVIIPDKLSEIVAKGEIAARYYNPGNLFDEVHILMINDDRVDPGAVWKTVGSARLHLHNLPAGREVFFRSLGWRPWLLKGWAEPAVTLARDIRPSLIRCYGNHLNAYLASMIKRVLGIPFVVSLHGNPDVDYFRGRLGRTWKEKIQGYAIESVEIMGIKEANYVLPVYQPIVPYLEKHKVNNYSVIYNSVGYNCIKKKSYVIDKNNLKAICIGRQQSLQKDPSSIIDAVIEMSNISLLIIGDGDLHESLVKRVSQAKANDRISFVRAMPNIDVLRRMNEADVFLYSSVNYEISKCCIEAALTGLPVVLNDRGGKPAPELLGGHFILVEGTKESYKRVLNKLVEEDQYRERMGRLAYTHAQAHWAPGKMEARVVEIYKKYMR